MTATAPLLDMLGAARYETYASASGRDPELTAALYAWNTDLSGAWHSHLSNVEIAIRNAMDRELSAWNATQLRNDGGKFGPDWTAPQGAHQAIYGLVSNALNNARKYAKRTADQRPSGHPRYQVPPTHDDIVSQLMFGAWSGMLIAPNESGPSESRKSLWDQCLHRAFPGADPSHAGLREVAGHVEGLRSLRNRVAHHENLLALNTRARLNGSLKLLRFIDPALPDYAMARNRLRRIAREDPREGSKG